MSRAAADVPEAWPKLLTREQLCAYLGHICAATLAKVCPVPPVDLGANVVRWNRAQIDAWLDGLPPRLPRGEGASQDAPTPAAIEAAVIEPNDRRLTAVEKARARALGRTAGGGKRNKWPRSPTSSGSAARTGS
jgi:hypothetical protein